MTPPGRGGLRGRIERALAEPSGPPVRGAEAAGRGSGEAGALAEEMTEGTGHPRAARPVERGPIDPWISGVYVLWSHRRPGPVRRATEARVVAPEVVVREGARAGAQEDGDARRGAVDARLGALAGAQTSASPERAVFAAAPPAGSTPRGPTLLGRMTRHAGAERAAGPPVVSAAQVGAGFVHAVTRWPRLGAAAPLLVGRPLELPGTADWRSAVTCLSRHAPSDILDRPVFLDVEATGLGHGAGTVAFVVGVAALEGEEWRVDQWLLSRLSAETAMLAALHERLIAAGGLLVTFNGASFDLPLLRGRLRRCGLDPGVLAGPHLDLLPVARRLWRGRGPDCRLTTLERLQLGARREGDISGRAIPEVFWAVLRDPDDRRARAELERVCAHNLVDVLTMPALALAMARTVATPADDALARRVADHLTAIGRRAQAEAVAGAWRGGPADAAARPGPERGPVARNDAGSGLSTRLQRTGRGAPPAAGPGS